MPTTKWIKKKFGQLKEKDRNIEWESDREKISHAAAATIKQIKRRTFRRTYE